MDDRIEKEYFDQLRSEGLSPSVTEFFQELARINQRSMTYFMIMALEELNMYLDNPPNFDIDMGEEEKETEH
tara:strand:+ start:1033 stop:1248 length:216 start_codon:yes stop_codon:yes gene_type:complete